MRYRPSPRESKCVTPAPWPVKTPHGRARRPEEDIAPSEPPPGRRLARGLDPPTPPSFSPNPAVRASHTLTVASSLPLYRTLASPLRSAHATALTSSTCARTRSVVTFRFASCTYTCPSEAPAMSRDASASKRADHTPKAPSPARVAEPAPRFNASCGSSSAAGSSPSTRATCTTGVMDAYATRAPSSAMETSVMVHLRLAQRICHRTRQSRSGWYARMIRSLNRTRRSTRRGRTARSTRARGARRSRSGYGWG